MFIFVFAFHISYNSHHKSWAQGGRTALLPMALFVLCVLHIEQLTPQQLSAGRKNRSVANGVICFMYPSYRTTHIKIAERRGFTFLISYNIHMPCYVHFSFYIPHGVQLTPRGYRQGHMPGPLKRSTPTQQPTIPWSSLLRQRPRQCSTR